MLGLPVEEGYQAFGLHDGRIVKVSLTDMVALVGGKGCLKIPSGPNQFGVYSALVSVHSSGGSPDSAVIYQRPQRPLSEVVKSWLAERMPETWLYVVGYAGTAPAVDPNSLRETTAGVFAIPLDDENESADWRVSEPIRDELGLTSLVDCSLALKVCDWGVTRFDLLKRADELARIVTKFHPVRVSLFGDGSRLALRVRPYSIVPFSLEDTAIMDKLVMRATMMHSLAISPSELMLLQVSYGNTAASYLQHLKREYRARTSALLYVDMCTRMSDTEWKALGSLIRSSGKLISSQYGIGDDLRPRFLFPFPKRDTMDHVQLFQYWMLARSQLGLPVYDWHSISLEEYLSLLEG